MKTKPKYKRILLKLSGEALGGGEGLCISPRNVHTVARQIKEVYAMKIQVGVVVGGGNIFRGLAGSRVGQNGSKTVGTALETSSGIERATGDYMGMLATIINALALQDALQKIKVNTYVQSAIPMPQIAQNFERRRAIGHLKQKRVVIFAGGTGNPYFTTDTAAALRAVEIGAQVILKATKVNGVYNRDPNKFKDAHLLDNVRYMEALSKQYKIMDSTAFSLCMDHEMPIIVFNLFEEHNIKRVVMGEKVGTLVTS